MITRSFYILIIIFFAQSLTGQHVELRAKTFHHFNLAEEKGLNWEKFMAGKIDERTSLDLFLITDATNYHGAYQIEGSSSIVYIDGEQGPNKVTLYTYDEEGMLTGTIEGDFSDHDFYGTWRDKKRVEELSFNAHDLNSNFESEYWLKSYGEDENYIQLTKTSLEVKISGRVNGLDLSGILECLDDECTQFFGSINSSEQGTQSISAKFDEDHLLIQNDEFSPIRIKAKNSLLFEYLEDNTLGKSYVTNINFNNSELNQTWNDLAKFENIEVKKSEEFESSQDVDIDFLGKRYLTGVIRYQNNESSSIIEKAFVIDLKRKQVLDYQSLFKKKDIIKSKVKEMIPTEYDLEELIITFNNEGLLIRTPFNLLYGQEQYTIQYEDLKRKRLN